MGAALAGMLALPACNPSPSGQDFAARPRAAQDKLQVIEVVARPVVESSAAAMRPAFPKDVVDIAIKTQGGTAGADLSVKMIALADGSTVGTRTVRLNPANAAAPNVQFEPAPAWAPGRYLFEVSLDGKLAGSQEMEVFPAELAEPAKS